jgi:alkylation response protein AidB-like acyl-CoA dehydrogenase
MNQMVKPSSSVDWIGRALDLVPIISAAADQTERERRVPDHVMDAIANAGLFKLLLPTALGGAAADLITYNGVIEALASADASTGWCVSQALTSSHAAGFLPPDIANEVFNTGYGVVAWGPPGGPAKAVAVEGGYRSNGMWRFASGAPHALWFGGHSIVCDGDGKPRLDPAGRPINRTMLFRREKVTMLDTWHVIGLKGTRSDDYTVSDLFVPDAYSTWRDSEPDRVEAGPLYNFPMLTLYGVGFAGVALGIAKASLKAFEDLAAKKVSGGGLGQTAVLKDGALVRADFARATARLGRARAFAHEVLGASWDISKTRGRFTLEERAHLRLAITGTIQEAAKVVDYAYHAAGSTAIYEGSAFERRFRDMHAVTAHGQSQWSNFEAAGQALFGSEPAQRL